MTGLDSLTDEQKEAVADLIIATVIEIRQQIIADTVATEKIWERHGWLKTRRTRQAFQAFKELAAGRNELDLLDNQNELSERE